MCGQGDICVLTSVSGNRNRMLEITSRNCFNAGILIPRECKKRQNSQKFVVLTPKFEYRYDKYFAL